VRRDCLYPPVRPCKPCPWRDIAIVLPPVHPTPTRSQSAPAACHMTFTHPYVHVSHARGRFTIRLLHIGCETCSVYLTKNLLHRWHLFRNLYCTFWNYYYTSCAPNDAILGSVNVNAFSTTYFNQRVTLTFDLQNRTRLSVGASGYSLSVQSRLLK